MRHTLLKSITLCSVVINTLGLLGNGVVAVVVTHKISKSPGILPFSPGDICSIYIHFLVVTLLGRGGKAEDDTLGVQWLSPRMLLKSIEYTGQCSQNKIIQPKMPIVPRLKSPGLEHNTQKLVCDTF